MDICVVTQPARREGGKTHAHQLLDILSEITDVSVLTANLSDDSSIREEYDVTEFSSKGVGESIPVAALRFLLNQIRMCVAIARRDDEVILFFGSTSYAMPVVFSRIIGKKVVIEPRGNVPLSLRLKWEEQAPNPVARFLAGGVWIMERASYRAATAIITYTPSMADELGLDKYENKLYPDGTRYVDTEKFYPEIDYDDREKLVGYIGRLDAEKGAPQLAELVQILPDDYTFVFVGDGDYREELEDELSHEVETGRAEFTGWVDHADVPQQLNRLKLLFLTTSVTEGLPTVILEAFACGTPVCSADVGGVSDVVRDGVTGFLIDKIEEVNIGTLLDERRLDEMSENCRSVAEDELSFDAAVERYSKILAEVG